MAPIEAFSTLPQRRQAIEGSASTDSLTKNPFLLRAIVTSNYIMSGKHLKSVSH